jgi:protease I
MDSGLGGKRIAMVSSGAAGDSASAIRAALEGAGSVVEELAAGEGGSGAAAQPSASDFAALVIVGGEGAPSKSKPGETVLQVVREFMLAERPLAVTGNGAAILVDAGVAGGRTFASPPELREAIEAAGGHWVDAHVFVDESLISARGTESVDRLTELLVREFGDRIDEQRIDQTSEQSFPASDPPPPP